MLYGHHERRVEVGERSVENINIFPVGSKGNSGYKRENLSITVEEIDKQQFDDLGFEEDGRSPMASSHNTSVGGGGFKGNRTTEVKVTNRLEGQGWAYRTGANSPSQQNFESSQQIFDLRTENETLRIQTQDMQSLKDANEALLRKLASKDQLLKAMECQMSNLLTEKSSIGSLILSQEKQMANLRDLISQKDSEIHALATQFQENDQKNKMLLDKLKEFQQIQPSLTPGHLESTPASSLNTNRDLDIPTVNANPTYGNKTALGLPLQDQKFLDAIIEEIKRKLIEIFGADYEERFE